MNLYATILAGGSGTRFWPRSRANYPKQFLVLQGTQSLLQATVSRLASLFTPGRILVVTAAHLQPQTMEQLPTLPPANILTEPVGRNTAPAIGLAAWHCVQDDPEAIMAVLPADHAIADAAAFCMSLQQAAQIVQHTDVLMTLGIQPTHPATGYGYIQVGERFTTPADPATYHVAQFTEKPALDVATQFVTSGQYLWNCGIFVWRAATILQEIHTHLPELWQGLQAYSDALRTGASPAALSQQYAQLPAISIDYGVLEKSSRVGVLPVAFPWNDVGSWSALAEIQPADSAGNVVLGQHLGRETSGLVVYSPDKLVATLGVRDLIVVCTDDVVFICPKERDQEVREFVQLLQQRGQTRYI